MRTLLSVALSIVLATSVKAVPLGFTQVESDFDFLLNSPRGGVVVNDGTAYIAYTDGMRIVDPFGAVSSIAPVSPSLTHDTLIGTTRVVADVDGNVLFAAGFSAPDSSRVWALYDVSDASTPVAVWEDAYRINGVDRNRRGLGQLDRFGELLTEFLPDGSFQFLPFQWVSNGGVTPSGVVGGYATIPGTIGAGPALLYPDGSIEIVSVAGDSGASVRDREDGTGLNVSFPFSGQDIIRYGSKASFAVDASLGIPGDDDLGVFPTESDFALVVRVENNGQDVYRGAFYPGISPLGEDRSVDLIEYFPDLQTINFSGVSVASADGLLHFLLRGEDGVWLYVTPDPTVVPEPAGS